MPAQVILDLGSARRRVDRDRNAPGEEDAEEAVEVIDAGRQHDRDRPRGLQVPVEQSRGDCARRPFERGIGDRLLLARVVLEHDVGALRVPGDVPLEDFDERRRAVRRRGLLGEHRRAPGGRGAGGGARRVNRAQQVARSLGARHHALRKAQGETALQAQKQLHASEAVESVIVLEPAVERRRRGLTRGMELGGELPYGLEQRFGAHRSAAAPDLLHFLILPGVQKHRNPPFARDDRVGSDLRERREHECAFVHSRVGNDESRLGDDLIAIEQEVEVERARGAGGFARAAEARLDREQLIEQRQGAQSRLDFCDRVDKVGLLAHADRRAAVERRRADEACLGDLPERGDGAAHLGFGLP